MRSETTNAVSENEWIPINVAARMLGISGPAIRNWIRQGKLNCMVKAEDRPRLGTQCKRLKHVCWKELTHLHQQVSRVRRSCAK